MCHVFCVSRDIARDWWCVARIWLLPCRSVVPNDSIATTPRCPQFAINRGHITSTRNHVSIVCLRRVGVVAFAHYATCLTCAQHPMLTGCASMRYVILVGGGVWRNRLRPSTIIGAARPPGHVRGMVPCVRLSVFDISVYAGCI